MKSPYCLWLHLAAKIMPQNNKAWLEAMSAECQEIADPAERHAFAAGCLKTALLEFARSRKGLNYIARGFGATALTAGSSVGIYAAIDMAANPNHFLAAQIILALCIIYMFGAVLLVMSLRALRIYAASGLTLAVLSWLYMQLKRPLLEALPTEFLSALNIETAALMGSLLFTATYLGWLYTPNHNEL